MPEVDDGDIPQAVKLPNPALFAKATYLPLAATTKSALVGNTELKDATRSARNSVSKYSLDRADYGKSRIQLYARVRIDLKANRQIKARNYAVERQHAEQRFRAAAASLTAVRDDVRKWIAADEAQQSDRARQANQRGQNHDYGMANKKMTRLLGQINNSITTAVASVSEEGRLYTYDPSSLGTRDPWKCRRVRRGGVAAQSGIFRLSGARVPAVMVVPGDAVAMSPSRDVAAPRASTRGHPCRATSN